MKKKKRILYLLMCMIILLSCIISSGGFFMNFHAAENEWNFGYTGDVEEWTVPYTGKYYIETWGAQGGGTKSKGGHSFGYINLHAGEKLTIAVGEKGTMSTDGQWTDGCYNGGGSAFGGAGSGGGATSITTTNRGELKNFVNNKDEVVMVSGGSGGIGSSFYYSTNGCYVVDEYLLPGYYAWVISNENLGTNKFLPTASNVNLDDGYGGGLQGRGCNVRINEYLTGDSLNGMNIGYKSTGGDKNSGFAFGYGGNGSDISNVGYGGAGGGGYYGGYGLDTQPSDNSSYRSVGVMLGAGGSGYLNDCLYEAGSDANINAGNGKAKITYCGEVISNYIIDIGDIGTIGGKSGTVTISGVVGTTGIIPKIELKEGYAIKSWEVEYNLCNTNIRPSTEEDVEITFEFGDIRIEPKYTAPLSTEVVKVSDTQYDLIFKQNDDYEKIYALSASYNGGITYEPVESYSSSNDLSFYKYNFGYIGGVQGWNVPLSGNWLLEASGGSASSLNSTPSGGYSKGYRRLTKGSNLYFCVGGAGSWGPTSVKFAHGYGGYNGGGYGYTGANTGATRKPGGAGGATSITTTNRGVLSNFTSYRGEVVLVAGGAGCVPWSYDSEGAAGQGGGLVGGNGSGGSSGGTQSSGYAFGIGGRRDNTYDDQGGGGGGWYGGTVANGECPGGGGSGYIGGVTNGTSITGGGKTYNGSATATYEKVLTHNTNISDIMLNDSAKPNTPSNGRYDSVDNTITVTWDNNGDNGTNVLLKIQSFLESDGDTADENALNTSLLNFNYVSGVKGFYYYIDGKSTGTVTISHTFTTDTSIDIPTSTSNRYLHVAAVDGAGNISGTYTMLIPSIAKYTVNHYAQNEDGSYVLVETEEFMDTIGKTVTPEVHPQTGRDNPPVQSIIITADGQATVSYYYDVTRFDINGSVQWNDHNNIYGTRPEDIKVTIYRDGEYFDEVIVSAANNSNGYSFPGVQKYDLETGREFVYTVEQETAYSQAALATSEDKYLTRQSGFNFLNTINNTNADKPEKPDPENPDDKGFYVEGDIYWNDNNDSLGFRPSKVTITLYQKGEDGEFKVFDSVIVDANTENHYLFDWLPKYWYDEDGVPTKYEYKVEETFTAWYVEYGVIKDAYEIHPDSPKDCDFTNDFVFPSGPIIPVNGYTNTLTVVTNTDEPVRVILKPEELIVNSDYSVSYGNPTGNNILSLVDKTGTVLTDLPSTRYEIVVDSPEYTIGDMDLVLSEHMKLEKVGDKWYLVIENQPGNAIGTLEIEFTKKEVFYQDRNRINNYFACLNDFVSDVSKISMMSLFNITAEEDVLESTENTEDNSVEDKTEDNSVEDKTEDNFEEDEATEILTEESENSTIEVIDNLAKD